MDPEIGGIVRRQALSFHPVTKLRLHQPIGVLFVGERTLRQERAPLFPGAEQCRKSQNPQTLLVPLPPRVSAKPDACAISWVAVLWRPG